MIHSDAANPIVARQIQLNQLTTDSWELFFAHRQQVTNLILSNRPLDGGRLCVLGAGNCNDIDLASFANRFAEIHLVDIDDDALSAASKRQQLSRAASIELHGGVDLTGIANQLSNWITETPSDIEIDALLKTMERLIKPDIGEPFDVVMSSAVLTQLIGSAVMALGTGHSRLLDVVLAIRTAHIRLLVNLVASGGSGVLVSDLVSSDTCPEVDTISEDKLPDLMQRCLGQKNFFSGVNPFALEKILRKDPYIAPQFKDLALIKPWRWRIGSRRSYLVYAFVFHKI